MADAVLSAPDIESEVEAATPERRRFLTTLAGFIAGATVFPAGKASAQRIMRPPRFPTKGPLVPVPKVASSTAQKLVNRITYGVTAEEMARVTSLGFLRYLDYQLDVARIDDKVVDDYVSTTWPLLAMDGNGLYQQSVEIVTRQLSEATLYRAAYSRKQLLERMVEFWTDHFTIYIPKVGYLKLLDDRDVVRKYALGKFPELLWASAHSPAMLLYLDQPQSRGNSPNQNYAREIMELHSLGVDGGYTQDDVAQLSRIFTGWTVQGRGAFNFDATGHDFTAKTFLGKTYPAQLPSVGAAAVAEGEDAVRTLANHPNTAKYIATKLTRYILRYDAPDTVLEAVTNAYLNTGGDIPSMLRIILSPANVAAASAKYKRPFHYVVSTMRATRTSSRAVTYPAGRALTLVGQPLFLHEQPDGYPDSAAYWAGNVLPRWNFASYISVGTTDLVVDVTPFMQGTAAGVVDAISTHFFGSEMPDTLRTALTAYVGTQAQSTTRVREACALAMSANEFMWF